MRERARESSEPSLDFHTTPHLDHPGRRGGREVSWGQRPGSGRTRHAPRPNCTGSSRWIPRATDGPTRPVQDDVTPGCTRYSRDHSEARGTGSTSLAAAPRTSPRATRVGHGPVSIPEHLTQRRSGTDSETRGTTFGEWCAGPRTRVALPLRTARQRRGNGASFGPGPSWNKPVRTPRPTRRRSAGDTPIETRSNGGGSWEIERWMDAAKE